MHGACEGGKQNHSRPRDVRERSCKRGGSRHASEDSRKVPASDEERGG
jgi:hypothetical protein